MPKRSEPAPRKPPTQRAIAAEAGVSQETVSFILNGVKGKRYSAETEERVRRIAAEMGYVPHQASLAIRRGRSNLIAVIHFGSPFLTGQAAVSYLPQVIRANGYDFSVYDLQWYGDVTERVISDLIAARVEGVVLMANLASLLPEPYLERLRQAGIPVVSLYGGDKPPEWIPLICGDVEWNTRRHAAHLLELGHRRLLRLVSRRSGRMVEGQSAGFASAFQGHGQVRTLTEAEFFSGPCPWQGGDAVEGILVRFATERYRGDITRMHYDVIRKLHALGRLPDAMMASNDQGAFGVFTAAAELGLRVPEDLAVTGVDNDPFGKYPAYRLTTLQPDIVGACEAAVETLLRLIRGQKSPLGSRKTFRSEMIIRGSCGARPLPEAELPDLLSLSPDL